VHVVLLERAEAHAGLRGSQRLIAQSALARDALHLSARASQAVLGALDKDAEEAPLPSNGWHWSLSHAGGFAAGAVCRAPIGIDVEAVAPRRLDIVKRVCSRDEMEVLGGFSWEAFVRAWTAKEAVLKKAGVGLLELGRCRLVAAPRADVLIMNHRERDHVVHASVRFEHVAAVAHDDVDALVEWSWPTVAGDIGQRAAISKAARGAAGAHDLRSGDDA
jgi:4'-phosphopantetheinyl transferase